MEHLLLRFDALKVQDAYEWTPMGPRVVLSRNVEARAAETGAVGRARVQAEPYKLQVGQPCDSRLFSLLSSNALYA